MDELLLLPSHQGHQESPIWRQEVYRHRQEKMATDLQEEGAGVVDLVLRLHLAIGDVVKGHRVTEEEAIEEGEVEDLIRSGATMADPR